jgi:hypothetical protein
MLNACSSQGDTTARHSSGYSRDCYDLHMLVVITARTATTLAATEVAVIYTLAHTQEVVVNVDGSVLVKALCGTCYTIKHIPMTRAAVYDSMLSSSSSSSSATATPRASATATPRASVQERVCTSNSLRNSDNSARSGSSTDIVTATGTAIDLGNA